jgi:hypothetical protein
MYSPAEETTSSVRYHRQKNHISDSQRAWRQSALIDIERSYRALADDPKYKHFVSIPARILRCVDYFGLECDRTETTARLRSYYLFIGVVDNAIDSGNVDTGELVLGYLSAQNSLPEEEIVSSSLRLVTEILKRHISDASYSTMMVGFRNLYREVVSERKAESIETYIEHRQAVGRLTAELSYELICPLLKGASSTLGEFMNQVGEVGCLVDSLIDLDADRRLGLLGFQPTILDRGKLISCTLRSGLSVWLGHPGLSGLFVQAVVDSVRDRFRGKQVKVERYLVADRKDEAVSVA